MNRTTNVRLAVSAGLLLVATACGGAAADDSTRIASTADLEGAEETTTTDIADDNAADADAEGDISAEDAALAVSLCMRENGFADFPDPTVENGSVNLRGALADSGIDFADDGFQTQIQACIEETGAENLGGGGAGRADIQNDVQENLLVYTQCLRDEGLDVGDLDFGNGAGGPRAGAGGDGAGNGGAGAGNGAGGDRAGNGAAGGGPGAGGGAEGRIAQFLGLDVDDPATAEALQSCQDVLADAFAGFGGGGPGAATSEPDDA